MIDNRAVVGWVVNGTWYCASHAEGKFGAALYRLPGVTGADGKPAQAIWAQEDWAGGPGCWCCNQSRAGTTRGGWGKVLSSSSSSKSWDVVEKVKLEREWGKISPVFG